MSENEYKNEPTVDTENPTNGSEKKKGNKTVYFTTFGIAIIAAVIHELIRGYSYDASFPDEMLWLALGHGIPVWGLSLIGTLKTEAKFKGWLIVFCILEFLYSVGAYDLLNS